MFAKKWSTSAIAFGFSRSLVLRRSSGNVHAKFMHDFATTFELHTLPTTSLGHRNLEFGQFVLTSVPNLLSCR